MDDWTGLINLEVRLQNKEEYSLATWSENFDGGPVGCDWLQKQSNANITDSLDGY